MGHTLACQSLWDEAVLSGHVPTPRAAGQWEKGAAPEEKEGALASGKGMLSDGQTAHVH